MARSFSAKMFADRYQIGRKLDRQVAEEIAKLPEGRQVDRKSRRATRNGVEKRNGDLVKLERLHHGRDLAAREVEVIEAWVTIQARDIDTSGSVDERVIQERLKEKIRQRFERRFPYIQDWS